MMITLQNPVPNSPHDLCGRKVHSIGTLQNIMDCVLTGVVWSIWIWKKGRPETGYRVKEVYKKQ